MFKHLIRFFTHPLRVTITEGAETYYHRAINLRDALEWLACYPRGTVGFVHSRLGRFIASRAA